jgi:hypothetical protein
MRLPQPDKSGQYRLTDISNYYERRVVPVGSLTVWAHGLMQTLATRLPEPNGVAFLSPSERIMVLGSTLTDAQWQKLGGSDGLGLSDLNKKQRELFGAILPDTLTLQYSGEREPGQPYPKPITLSGPDVQKIRLRATRRLDWSFGAKGSRDWHMQMGLGSEPYLPNAAPYRINALRGQEGQNSGFGMTDGFLYGVKLREVVPVKQKPGHLSFDWSALSVSVNFGEAKTVGDLVRQIAQATGAALHCDPRYRDLPLYVRGTGAQAGDLCRALCWGVSGTWRKVGDRAFVLTDDLEGLATRQARIANWAMENAARAEQLKQESVAKLAVTDFGSHIHFAPGDPFALTGATAQKVEEQRRARIATFVAGPPANGQERQQKAQALQNEFTPIRALPPAMQEVVQRQIAAHRKSSEREADSNNPVLRNFPRPTINDEAVRLDVGVQLWFVVPGVGVVPYSKNGLSSHPSDLTLTFRPDQAWGRQTWNPYDLPDKDAPVLPQAPPKSHVLSVVVQNEEQAQAFASGAKRAGFGELWVEVEPGEQGANLLAQTVNHAQKQGLKVRGVVRVLRTNRRETPATLRDRNVLGETWSAYVNRRESETKLNIMGTPPQPLPHPQHGRDDYLVPSDEANRLAFEQASSLARTPGLAGLVLRDTTPPGYTESEVAGYNPFRFSTEPLGYTEAQRLEFLQASGVDPLDIGILPIGRIPLPFSFSDGIDGIRLERFSDWGMNPQYVENNGQPATQQGAKTAPADWIKFRIAQAQNYTDRLVKQLAQAHPQLPVLVERVQLSNDPTHTPQFWFGTPGNSAEFFASLRPKPVPQPNPQNRTNAPTEHFTLTVPPGVFRAVIATPNPEQKGQTEPKESRETAFVRDFKQRPGFPLVVDFALLRPAVAQRLLDLFQPAP